MWLADDYEGNGNTACSDGYEGGWEGTSAAYEQWRCEDAPCCGRCE